jgi:osmoprotectant transport system ATP-binding protein
MELIRLEGVSKYFQQVPVLQSINLSVREGETVVLLGPSGCGKTTLLKLINGLITPESGKVFFKDELVLPESTIHLRRKTGYVIQDVGLFPHLTVDENIMMPRRIAGNKRSLEVALDWLKRVGLDSDLINRLPGELSGGQQQRVGIARALINDPELILMDEPFSALDTITRGQLQNDFLKLESLIKKTCVLVTHDIPEAFKLGDRIVLLNQGIIQQIGKPLELLMNPQTPFVAEFLAHDRLQLELEHIRIGDPPNSATMMEVLLDPDRPDDHKIAVFDQYVKMRRRND